MQMNEAGFSGVAPVDGYGPGFFRIGGQVHDGAVLTGPDGPGPWGGLDDRAPLMALAGRVDVLLVGTGAAIAPLPTDLRHALETAGVGVETMGSPAACRTYNVLLAEGRRVALAALAL